MKRCAIAVLLACQALAASATLVHGGEVLDRMRQQKQKYPPKYKFGTMTPYYVYRDRDGNMKARRVYPGYAEGFPPPAMFYYGYPHSGDDTGIGPRR
jgi:hypothetical protein